MSRTLNGNLTGKAAHGVDDIYGVSTLSERDLLVVKIDAIKRTVAGSFLPTMSSFQSQQKLALIDAEKDLADYDALNAVNDAQDIEQVIDSSLKMVRIPFDDHSLPVGERVAILQGTSELRPTYDQLISGAKFTDEHRAELHKWWNEKYK